MKLLLLFSTFISSTQVVADGRAFGHLLTRNDYLLEEKTCVVGIEFTGCKIGNSTIVGTSPFLIFGYDLKNIYIRQRISTSEEINQTIDLGLVDNIHKRSNKDFYYTSESNAYDMSAIMLNYITTFNLSNSNKLSWNNSAFYYPNYRRPFSLRRPDPKLKKIQFNSSVLFESPFSQHVGLASEIGLLQFNGKYPRIQGGASLDFHTENFLVKIGFSISSTLAGMFVSADKPDRHDYQQELLLSREGFYQELDREKVKYDFALHPEVNIQYTF